MDITVATWLGFSHEVPVRVHSWLIVIVIVTRTLDQQGLR
jgi:hypothetical protein